MAVKVSPELKEKIEKLRTELNHSIDNNPDQVFNSESYYLSKELDKLIVRAMKESSEE